MVKMGVLVVATCMVNRGISRRGQCSGGRSRRTRARSVARQRRRNRSLLWGDHLTCSSAGGSPCFKASDTTASAITAAESRSGSAARTWSRGDRTRMLRLRAYRCQRLVFAESLKTTYMPCKRFGPLKFGSCRSRSERNGARTCIDVNAHSGRGIELSREVTCTLHPRLLVNSAQSASTFFSHAISSTRHRLRRNTCARRER